MAMVLWYRAKQPKIKLLSNQLKRCYFQIPCINLIDYAAKRSTNFASEKRLIDVNRNPTNFFINARFSAGPAQRMIEYQAKPSREEKEEKESSGPRINEKIKARIIRLVKDEGHSIIPMHAALKEARDLKLDLVESLTHMKSFISTGAHSLDVDRKSDPPVCKIMDYHRERYKLEVREKERSKIKAEGTLKTSGFKEVRFKVKTELKDLRMKADMTKRLMERGYRVKCMAMGTAEDQNLGEILSRVASLLEDVAIMESGIQVGEKQAYMIVRHVKFGALKKGVGKQSKPARNKEESEDEPAWSVDEPNDDFDQVFKLNNEEAVTDTTSPMTPAAAAKPIFSPPSSKSKPVLDSIGNKKLLPKPSTEHGNRYIKNDPNNQLPRNTNARSPYTNNQLPPKPSTEHENRYTRNDQNNQLPRDVHARSPYTNTQLPPKPSPEPGNRYIKNDWNNQPPREMNDRSSAESRQPGFGSGGIRPPYGPTKQDPARLYNQPGVGSGIRPPYEPMKQDPGRVYNNSNNQPGVGSSTRPPYEPMKQDPARLYNNSNYQPGVGSGIRPPYEPMKQDPARLYNNSNNQPGVGSGIRPPYEPMKQNPVRPNASDTPKQGYGIFSAPVSRPQRTQDDENSTEPSRNNSPVSPNPNQRQVDPNAGQGRWGIFSK